MTSLKERQNATKYSPDMTLSALDLLRVKGTSLYNAAYPGYQSNFSRDSLLYGLLASDDGALLDQVAYSTEHQGKKSDPETGEEPGKIHHEFPSGLWRGRPTVYNACDTTAMYLIAIATLVDKGHDDMLIKYRKSIRLAMQYIRSHVKNNLFFESPALCGASNFAVRVTYWKDSVLNGQYEEPTYPIVFSLVHFQNAYALRVIGRVTNDPSLVKLGNKMIKVGIDKLWEKDHFIVARDGEGVDIDSPSSDSLHALLFIEPSDLPAGHALAIEHYMRQLKTKAGYRAGIPVSTSKDDYHTRYVWTHEQALLNSAALKHGLNEALQISGRVVNYLDTLPELIDPSLDYAPAGNSPQLWVIGAAKYFNNRFMSMSSTVAQTKILN
jgi:hypothetical protein